MARPFHPPFRPAALALLCLSLAQPVAAQDRPDMPGAAPSGDMTQGRDLVERGIDLFLRGLLSELAPKLDGMQTTMQEAVRQFGPALEQMLKLVDDVGNYDAPERLQNGDIIFRRKAGAPPPPPLPKLPEPGTGTSSGPGVEL